MENLAHKTEISSAILGIVADMRLFSFEEKKHASQAEKNINDDDIDSLLDDILDIKKKLINQTETINLFNTKIEKLTWYNNLEDNNLLLINDLIACLKDAYSSFIRQCNTLDTFKIFKRRKIAKNEIENFKNAVEEIKETYQDLESVFFFLPAMPDFKDTTKQLSLI